MTDGQLYRYGLRGHADDGQQHVRPGVNGDGRHDQAPDADDRRRAQRRDRPAGPYRAGPPVPVLDRLMCSHTEGSFHV